MGAGGKVVDEGSVQTSVNIIQSRVVLLLLLLVGVLSVASLLPQQVEHSRLQVVSEGADGRHQPVGAEAGVRVHHALGDVHLWRRERTTLSQCHGKNKQTASSSGCGLKEATHADVWS